MNNGTGEKKMLDSNKLNIGCRSDIKPNYVNLDSTPLPGVDVAYDLNKLPWPFEDNTYTEIFCKNVLEHLSDTVKIMEEIYRISKSDCRVFIRVPYWNSYVTYADPTHKKGFHKMQFEFFYPTKEACKNRPYYSNARFKIVRLDYFIYLGGVEND